MTTESDQFLRGSLNHVRITVTDIPRATNFYDPLLAYLGYRQEKADEQRVAWSQPDGIGGWRKFIVSKASEESRHKGHDRYAPGLHHVGFNVASRAEVDEFHRLLLSRDVEVLDAPAFYDYQPGYYAVYFADPDGIKLEVVHIPPIAAHS